MALCELDVDDQENRINFGCRCHNVLQGWKGDYHYYTKQELLYRLHVK